jgi:hypothetical protein
MAPRKEQVFPSITEMLGLLTPTKIERALEKIQIVLVGMEGKDAKIRLLVAGEEFQPILSEKSLIGLIVKGSTLWLPDEPKGKNTYSSFMLVDAKNVAEKVELVAPLPVDAPVEAEIIQEDPLSSTDFLLKNRKAGKKIPEGNLKAFKKGTKDNTSFIINKKSQ